MSDAVADALAGAGGQGGGDGGQSGGQGGGDGGQALPGWFEQAGLPDDLRANADLLRMQSVADLAKGYVETRAWAKGRVAIPQGDDEAAWKEFGGRLRPETADAYGLHSGEGEAPESLTQFASFAHDLGLPPRWAKSLVDFDNRRMADAASKIQQGNLDQLKAIELELGSEAYNRRVDAVSNMFKAAGIEDFDALKGLESSAGAGKTMKLLFALAEKTGELEKVDPTDVALRMGAVSPQAAQAKIDAASQDAEFMKKAQVPGSREAEQWKAWNLAAAGA